VTRCPFCDEPFGGLSELAYHLLNQPCTQVVVNRDHYRMMVEKRQREDRLMREDRAVYEAARRAR
jgi:hypothetical protein